MEGLNQLDVVQQTNIQLSEQRPKTPLHLISLMEMRKMQIGILKEFLLTKKIEGCKAATIKNYHDTVIKLMDWANPRDVRELETKDIRNYLFDYQENRKVSKSTINTIRLILSSFYEFMEAEDIVAKNPVRKIHKIKTEDVIRKPFTDEEIATIRRSAKWIRDLALIDLLYSSGIRISECINLNIKDLDFIEREMIVFGKGEKERICYFNANTKVELIEYLKMRGDENSALFVSSRYPYNRLGKGGIVEILKDIETRTGIVDIHPHRFRRTLATNLLNKGMPLEQVQQVLGHKKIETTLIYAKLNQSSVKTNHRNFT